MSVVLSFIAGLVLGLLAFVITGGGVPGLIVGFVCTVLGYVGVSLLFERRRKLGGVDADSVPDGTKALAALDEAKSRVGSIATLTRQIKDKGVSKEANDFIAATNALIAYVQESPNAWRTLSHYISVYGEQTESLLSGYLDVERSNSTPQLGPAKADAVRALDALERAAAGELRHAVETKALSLSADSEAIVRLAGMDGYDETDAKDAETPNAETKDTGLKSAESRNPGFRNTDAKDEA
ncbi:5-bromo-4-chloroindolyl phosphate hydrolysis family protein [Bifidobacterium tibiigranuli]|jgi:hypothetical protein|uniref:5-bromo-4-chloroindolyl phosphate hydrolysis family protein n=1 Tax=Bifidobacterium tibiigranuli TaxID=2172043 RepID=UPI0023572B63|nr:5-bromo-4-chloroindolyl phosphate hydrolysis family protein [Bifidobacterium tibiigranuli]MCI1210503.1 5-bromo-4-chloroindolyl phosphate hydrolysis family protein [Bifidobacterium tibiigranuli]MCI1220985.1 5-bromo-4-chloroindolyl phosphate hydrolysis family protein [Bifidobacterium tibiigranuli]